MPGTAGTDVGVPGTPHPGSVTGRLRRVTAGATDGKRSRPHLLAVAPVVALTAGALAAGLPAPVAAQAAGPYAPATQEFVLPGDSLDEVSGLAASRTSPGALWLHEDDGNSAVVTALSAQGQVRLRLELTGRDATDWEDLAVGPAADGCGTRLVIGDTGSRNDATGSDYGLLLVDEPAVPSSGSPTVAAASTYVPTRMLEDGVEVTRDAEALLVHPATGQVGVVTKSPAGRSRLFTASAAALDAAAASGDRLTLEDRGLVDLPVPSGASPLVTGGDVAPGADHVVLRTYDRVLEYRLDPDELLETALRRAPDAHAAPAEEGGEAITYDAAGRDLLLTGEVAGSSVWRQRGSSAAPPIGPTCVRRVDDADPVDRSAALSAATFAPGGPDAVVVVRADLYPDGLSGSTLAAEVGGPVLLSAPDGLDAEVAAEVVRLDVDRAYLLGGEAALPAQVADDLAGLGVEVVRLSGFDRWETNAAVVREVVRLGGPVSSAVVALGGGRDPSRDWADALAAGPLSGAVRAPVLLTLPGELPPAVTEVLVETVPAGSTVFVAGGPAAVGTAVEDRLELDGWQAERRSGPDRYGTAVALAEEAFARGADDDLLVAVSGLDFPDALAAGPAALAGGGAVLLVDPADLDRSPASRDLVERLSPGLDEVRVLGDAAAVSPRVVEQLREATRR